MRKIKKMTAEINEFETKNKFEDTDEMHCSFCGVPKSKAFRGFLIHGPNANICAECVNEMRKTLNPEPDEPSVA